MEIFENVFMGVEKDCIHLKCTKDDDTNFNLDELLYILETTKQAIENYYRVFLDIDDELFFRNLSPEIIAVRNGCIDFSLIIKDVVINIFATTLIRLFKKTFVSIVNKRIKICLKKKKMFKSEKQDSLLSSIGSSFFVSYLYCLFVDKTYTNWTLINNSKNRISCINNNYSSWNYWLKKITKMNDSKLSKNAIGLNGGEIKHMASVLLNTL